MNNFFLASPVGKGNNFVKKLECCISGGHYMIISSYQLSFFVDWSNKGLMPKKSALESLYCGQFTYLLVVWLAGKCELCLKEQGKRLAVWFSSSVVPMIFMPNPSHSARSISFSLASKVSSSNFSQSGSLATWNDEMVTRKITFIKYLCRCFSLLNFRL